MARPRIFYALFWLVNKYSLFMPQLIGQIDRLQARNAKGYVYTNQHVDARKKLNENGALLVSGLPGEGKSTLASMLLIETVGGGKCLKLSRPEDWSYVYPSTIQGVFIDDAFGAYRFDEGMLLAWQPILDEINDLVQDKECICIITCRAEVLAECESKLKRFQFLRHRIHLSSTCLTKEEKSGILLSCLTKHNRNMDTRMIEECIDNFEAKLGFPYCCKLFSADPSLYDQGTKYFEKPYGFLVDNLKEIGRMKLATLILLFHNKGAIDETLIPSLIGTFSDINEKFGEGAVTTPDTISRCIEQLCDAYLQEEEGVITFNHNIIYQAVGLIYATLDQAEVIRVCTVDFFCQCLNTDPNENAREPGTVLVHRYNYETLALRIFQEVQPITTEQSMLLKCIKHMTCKHDWPIKSECWKCEHKRQAIYNACAFGEYWSIELLLESVAGIRGQVPKGFVKDYSLERAYGRGKTEIVTKLVEAGLEVTRGCLLEGVLSGSANAVRHCISLLQQQGKWSPDYSFVVGALELAYQLKNSSVIQILERSGSTVGHKSVYDSLLFEDNLLATTFINKLSQLGKWDPKNKYVLKAFRLASDRIDLDMMRVLADAGVFGEDIVDMLNRPTVAISHEYLYISTLLESAYSVHHCIRTLQYCQKWDPCHKCAIEALTKAFCKGYYEIALKLLDSGVATEEHIISAAKSNRVEVVEKCVHALQTTDQWGTSREHRVRALEESFGRQQYEIAEILLDSETVQCEHICKAVVFYMPQSIQLIRKCALLLKQTDAWAPDHRLLVQALQEAFSRGHFGVALTLLDEGVSEGINYEQLILIVRSDFEKKNDLIQLLINKLQATHRWNPYHDLSMKALSEAVRKRNGEGTSILIAAGVTGTVLNVLILSAVRSNLATSQNFIESCVQNLKRSNRWDPCHMYITQALEEAFSRSLYDIARVLITEGVTTVTVIKHILLAVESGVTDSDRLVKMGVMNLKRTHQWNPCHKCIIQAADEAIMKRNYEATQVLFAAGVGSFKHILLVIESHIADGDKLVAICINNLKNTNQWNPYHEHMIEAANKAVLKGNSNIAQLLFAAGVPLR